MRNSILSAIFGAFSKPMFGAFIGSKEMGSGNDHNIFQSKNELVGNSQKNLEEI